MTARLTIAGRAVDLAMLARWHVAELEQARICLALARGGRHSASADAAEHEARAALIKALIVQHTAEAPA